MVSVKLLYTASLFSLALGAQNGLGGRANIARAQGGRGGKGNTNSATTSAAAAAATAASGNNNAATNKASTGSGSDSTTLQDDVIQKGSFVDGSTSIGAAESGQALSQTSQNNFINFCSGQTLTNGLQITTGSCNGIVMGQIPAKTNMISTVITNPQNGQSMKAGVEFNITVQTDNLVAGSFTNADATYYAAPQTLQNGNIIGHVHVTVQDMGNSLNPTTPPDATKFAFFKGINDAGNGNGLLSATVVDGLPAGNYRVCTLTSSSNHQPVIMPVAQRGSQDDCTRFTVTGNGGSTNVAADDGTNGIAAAALAQSAVDAGAGFTTSTAAASSTSTTANKNAAKSSTASKDSTTAKTSTTAKASSTAKANTNTNTNNANNNNNNANSGKGQNNRGQRLARLSRRTFVA